DRRDDRGRRHVRTPGERDPERDCPVRPTIVRGVGSRLIGAVLGVLALGALAAAAAARPAENAGTLADTYVSAGAPRSSFAHSRALQVGVHPTRVAYMRFQLGGPGGAIDGGGLRVFEQRSAGGGGGECRGGSGGEG